MDQDNTGISNPIAQETASTTNENNVETANKITVESVPPTTPTSSTDSKKPKALIATVIICAILALAGVGASIYFAMDSNSKSSQVSDLQSKLDLIKAETGAEIVETKEDDTTIAIVEKDSSTDFDKKVRDLIAQLQEATSSLNYSIVPTYDYGRVLVKNAAAKTLLPIQKSYGLYGMVQGSDFTVAEEFVNIINNKLIELGFVNNDDIEGPMYITGGDNLINRDSQIACNLTGGVPFTVNCSHLSWLTEETINLANQLAEAYHEKTGEYPFSINLSHYEIKDSQVASYQTLNVPVANAMGLFFRTSPDSNWQFFKTTQSVIPCQEYNTTDIKNAFAGSVCYDEATGNNSTVQP